MGDFKAVPDMILPYEDQIRETLDKQVEPINRSALGSEGIFISSF